MKRHKHGRPGRRATGRPGRRPHTRAALARMADRVSVAVLGAVERLARRLGAA